MTNGGGSSPHCAGLPTFTLSPPKPSAQMATLNNALFRRPGATLETVSEQLLAALASAGYVEHGFFCVPGGFAVATRLERIRDDKSPFPGDARWETGPNPLVDLRNGFSLSRIIDGLINADPGRYRMLLFYVTDRAVRPTSQAASASIMDLPAGGRDELPDDFADFPYSPAYRVRALVYEFARPSVAASPAFVPQTVPARLHLQRAGLRGLRP